ncbi:MAG TPA: FAD-dependent oxidoreductase [Roseiarcus sp.]|jgi:3-phenylpropionate/trans-cinnamate dioxygenase ferredoxin reductase subunit
MSLTSVVIVGAGHAGVQAAASLREQGFGGEIVLLSAEKDLPYQRPPLSKAFLKGEMDIHGLPLRADAHFREQRIDLRLGVSATRIDRAAQKVEFTDGGTIAYGHLILATGARQRRLDVPGVDLPGVFALRDIADATAIRERLSAKPRVVIIGAGFIGLEIAATAVSLGAEATVVEIARPMGRAVSPILSDFFLKEHAVFGARFKLGVGVAAIEGREHAEQVILTDGEALAADMVVVGIGVVAEDVLARACGLECDNGIVVDEFLTTSDPAISAIGDCAHFPHAALGLRTRLESVQNAVDQGKAVAARLVGKPKPYNELAWFWSDQGDLKLMIAGLAHGVDAWVVRGDPGTRAFSTFGFRDGKLAVVESVNRAGDHAAAKRIIGTTKTMTPEEAADPAFDLRGLAKR